MVLGSALEITVPAAISSPVASTTPAARSSRTLMRATAAPVRISTPAARAAPARAADSAPSPPRGCCSTSAPRVAAARYKSDITVPGERGPRLLPSTASSASAPLSSGRLEVLFQQVVHAHARRCAAARACRCAPAGARRARVRGAWRDHASSRTEPRRGRAQYRVQRTGQTLQLRLPGGIAVGVGLRARAQAAQVAWSECQMPPVGVQRRARHVIARQRQAVTRQVELTAQRRRHQVQQVGAGRHREAGRELARHRRTAQLLGGLQQQHRPAAARQVGRANQPVVAAADDDAVVGTATGGAHCRRPRSRRMASAALAPGAPMTPPPGWVLEPHMYMPSHRRAVLRVTRDRAVEQQLIEGQLALEDVALGQAHLVLDVPRRADLGMQDEILEVRAVARDRIDHGVAERLTALPASTPLRPADRGSTARTPTCSACRRAPWSDRSATGSACRRTVHATSGPPSSRRRRAPPSRACR